MVDDGTSYGRLLTGTFVAEAQRRTATVVSQDQVRASDTDFSGLIAKIAPLRPDAVYFGGTYPTAGPLSAQLATAGLDIPLMSGDGIIDPQYVALGGRANDLATNVGAPAQALPGAAPFLEAYTAAHYRDPDGAYGVTTYDAANVVITAVAAGVRDGAWSADSRSAVVQNVQATNLQGATGPIAFDRYGDTTNRLITVYTVSGSTFAPVEGSTRPYVD